MIHYEMRGKKGAGTATVRHGAARVSTDDGGSGGGGNEAAMLFDS